MWPLDTDWVTDRSSWMEGLIYVRPPPGGCKVQSWHHTLDIEVWLYQSWVRNKCKPLKSLVTLLFHICYRNHFDKYWPVADPGFPWGGGINSPGGGQHMILPNFPKNLHEIERIWTRGVASKILLCRSATADSENLELNLFKTCTIAMTFDEMDCTGFQSK